MLKYYKIIVKFVNLLIVELEPMKTLIRVSSIAILSLINANLIAQNLTLGPDTTICPGQNLTLTATMTPGPAPTNVTFCSWGQCDDYLSTTWVPIGFTFNFYGNNYTQCLVSSNAYITFTGTPGGYSPWAINNNAPSAANPLNVIMCPWQDAYPGLSGTGIARYKTIGTAPNRVFIVEWLNIPSFSCGTATCYGAQVHLYETSNIIETHIFRHQPCAGWNGGRAIHGLQNATGAIAHIVPGRNMVNGAWTVNNDGYRFTPTSSTNYTLAPIPFNPVYMPNTPPAPASITWTANGVNIGTGTTQNVTPTTTTNYVISVPYASCNSNVTYRDTLRVNMGNLTLNTSPNTSVCLGDSVEIWVSTTAAGTTNYVWSPSVSVVNPNSDTTMVFPTTATTYTVTATNGLCTNSAQVTVDVNPLPTINFNVTDPYICAGDMVNLTASGGTSYNWFMGTNMSSTNTASTDVSPLVDTQYGVEVTDANGCVDSAYNNVYIYTPPTITVNLSEPSICPGYSMGLTANGGNTYQWTPSTGLDFDNVSNPNATLSATTTYTVVGTDVNGCVGDTTVTVIVDPLPNVDFTADKFNGCEPVTVNFLNNSTISAGSISSYSWSFEGHGTSNATNPTITYPQDGLFDVSLVAISDMGCVDSLTQQGMIHIYNIPTAGFFANPQPTTIGDPEITFTNTSSGDVSVWDWDFGGLGNSSYSDPIFSFNQPGQFEVTLIVQTQYGCSDTTSSYVQIDDLSEIFIPNSFTPNDDGMNDTWFPVGRNLNTLNLYIEVHVFNRWGTRVFRSTTSDKPWNGRDQNIGEECPQGVYTYRVIFINEQGKEKRVMGHINMIR